MESFMIHLKTKITKNFLTFANLLQKDNCLLSMFYFGINNYLRGNSNYITIEHSDDAKLYMQIQYLPNEMIYTTLINNKWSANSIDPVNYFSPVSGKKEMKIIIAICLNVLMFLLLILQNNERE